MLYFFEFFSLFSAGSYLVTPTFIIEPKIITAFDFNIVAAQNDDFKNQNNDFKNKYFEIQQENILRHISYQIEFHTGEIKKYSQNN